MFFYHDDVDDDDDDEWVEEKREKPSKCENYLTAVTNRSRYLIHFRSTQRLPILEVQFRNPSRGPGVHDRVVVSMMED